jgi:23S rRNA (uracil1939-C5)-methyltransferase
VSLARVDRVESLDLQGRGVVRNAGKVTFIEGALPGETIRWEPVRSGRNFDLGQLLQVQRESSLRVRPRCPHFGLQRGACGGCSMQHLEARAQIAVKQRVLEDALWHIGRLKPQQIARPIAGIEWGYRHRARLSVRFVARRGEVLVGFHERASSFVADIRQCDVLAGSVGSLLPPLRALIGSMHMRQRLPQIEVAVTDTGGEARVVLVFRILEPLSDSDREALVRFGAAHRVSIWVQSAGPASAQPLIDGDERELTLHLPEFGLRLPFGPTDFTQVNHSVNEVLVRRALTLLRPQPTQRALDLFCGLGNFALPLATRMHRVIGIDVNSAQLARAARAAQTNGLQGAVDFVAQDLFGWSRFDWEALIQRYGTIERVLIDPPREGALAVARALASSPVRPQRLVYVSCNPATLARDCAVLVHEGGWHLSCAGIVNMFPHTSHVESITLLEPPAG